MIGSAIVLSRQPAAILNLPGGVSAVAARANQQRVGTAHNPVEDRIVSSVEEVFHHAGHHREIFRRGEDIAVGLEESSGPASAA